MLIVPSNNYQDKMIILKNQKRKKNQDKLTIKCFSPLFNIYIYIYIAIYYVLLSDGWQFFHFFLYKIELKFILLILEELKLLPWKKLQTT
jgi:ABC-type phosphate transport system permease subunit